jgi:hypothetical protein
MEMLESRVIVEEVASKGVVEIVITARTIRDCTVDGGGHFEGQRNFVTRWKADLM